MAVRDTGVFSRIAVFCVPLDARDNESAPRTAAGDAPVESANAIIEIISLFISVYIRLAKNKNAPQVYFTVYAK